MNEHPCIYCGVIGTPPVAFAVDRLICIGDENSPGRVFVDHYYDLSEKSVEQALFLGVHAMRIAHQNKAAYIGEPNVWVYQSGFFMRLNASAMAPYITRSKSLDDLITNGDSPRG
jgi:hypothetical protein